MRLLFSYGPFILSLLLIASCFKPIPEELRNLTPVKITVLKEGEPLEQVLVSLAADRSTVALLARSGMTDASGVATIDTSFRTHFGTGVQPGTYTVTLQKNTPFPPELQEKENEMDLPENEKTVLEKKRRDFFQKSRAVPPFLADESSSPIKLTVAEKTGATLTVDVSDYY